MAVHVVEKQVVELKLSSEASSQELLRRVQPLFENFITEDLAQCFDLYDTGEVIQIDRLELDLGRIHIDRFDAEIREALKLQLTAYLRENVKALHQPQGDMEVELRSPHTEGVTVQGKEQYYIAIWLFFMQNGYFPASFTGTFHTLSLHILEILNAQNVNPYLKRRVLQFEDEAQLLRFIMHASDVLLYKAFGELKGLPNTFSEQNWMSWKDLILKLLKEHAPDKPTDEQILKFFRSFLGNILSKRFSYAIDIQGSEDVWRPYVLEVFQNEQSPVVLDEKKGQHTKLADLFVKNVGVVILAPYLLPFFQNLKLVSQRKFSSEEDKEKAIKILCYLATGGFECTEDELSFFKILCGHPLGMPIDINRTLPSHFYQEAESLLESILEHWTVMKGSSSDALRETFLSRGGKLVDQAEYYLLKVENKGVDILLDKIPWTFRTVKLPWMPKSLLVEWY